MDVVFMGSPDFAVPSLEALCEAEIANVVGVVTQPDRKKGRGQKVHPTPVKETALEAELEVFQPEDITAQAALEQLKEWSPDLIVVVAYGQILTKEILNLPAEGCINVHASLLPDYRGAAPIHWAIINGDDKTGVTTMYMDEGMDTGDMILKEEVTIKPEDTVGSLHDKLAQSGAEVLIETLEQVRAGTAPPTKQEESKATYARKLDKKDAKIDWEASSVTVWNLIRGTNPWPGAYTYLDGSRLKIWQAEVYSQNEKGAAPGTIVQADTEEGIIVQTGEGQLLVTNLQPAGKQKMTAADYLLGYDLAVGDKLGE
jgi:methionyl-tRNA formyltransferase